MGDDDRENHEPLLVPAIGAASIVGISLRQFTNLVRSGWTPRAMHLGRLRRWRVAELRLWIARDYPCRHAWEADEHGERIGGDRPFPPRNNFRGEGPPWVMPPLPPGGPRRSPADLAWERMRPRDPASTTAGWCWPHTATSSRSRRASSAAQAFSTSSQRTRGRASVEARVSPPISASPRSGHARRRALPAASDSSTAESSAARALIAHQLDDHAKPIRQSAHASWTAFSSASQKAVGSNTTRSSSLARSKKPGPGSMSPS